MNSISWDHLSPAGAISSLWFLDILSLIIYSLMSLYTNPLVAGASALMNFKRKDGIQEQHPDDFYDVEACTSHGTGGLDSSLSDVSDKTNIGCNKISYFSSIQAAWKKECNLLRTLTIKPQDFHLVTHDNSNS